MPLRIVPGSTITSTSVDRNKQYVDGRNLENLRKVGALTGAASDVAERVDGIIDNQPPNGQTGIDEIIRVEQPEYKQTLFPEEQQALPSLWKQLEWVDVPAAAEPPTLNALVMTDVSRGPGGFDFNQPVKIVDLPQELQKIARRLQLVLNSDDDASTLNMHDLEQGIAAPGRFTRSDVEQMQQLVLVVKEKLRGNGTLEARISVPDPGVRELPIPHKGQIRFSLRVETKIRETRSVTAAGRPGDGSFSAQLQCQRMASINVEVPAGKMGLLIDESSGSEALFQAGTTNDQETWALHPGTYRVELWEDGKRIESSEVKIPAHGPDNLDLTPYLDHALSTSDGKLHKNLVEANQAVNYYSPYGTQYTATYEYSLTQAPADAAQAAIAKLTDTPRTALTPGRYAVPTQEWGTLTFDVYPEGVMKFLLNGRTDTMQARVMSGGLLFDNGGQERDPSYPRVVFNTTTNELTAYTNAVRNKTSRVVITDAMRVG